VAHWLFAFDAAGMVIFRALAWPAAELKLSVTDRRWTGIGDGHGYLTGRTRWSQCVAVGQQPGRLRPG
jgi:hypothetical protein